MPILLLRISLFAFSSVTAVAIGAAADTATPDAGPIADSVRENFSLDAFYERCAIVGGVPVVGSSNVHLEALAEAAFVIQQMLSDRPQVLTVLASNRGRVCVMAAGEMSSLLPEFAPVQKPARIYYDRRGRGYGNHIACSVGEENLLHFAGDPYSTESILVHEFAHLLEKLALDETVVDFEAKLAAAYEAAMADGLWKNTYAASNKAEYWAEATQSWFGTNRQNDRLHNHVDTRVEVKEYDPRVAALLTEAYGDGEWRYTRADTRWDTPHLATWDAKSAPVFSWPKEVVARYEALKRNDRKAREALVSGGVQPLDLEAGSTAVSQGRGDKTTIMFVNALQHDIHLMWVKPNGETKDYGSVRPGDISSRSTFAGHVWEVFNTKDESLGRIRAVAETSRVLISDD